MISGADTDRQRGRSTDRHRDCRGEETAKDHHFTDHHQYPPYGQANQDSIASLPPGKRQVMDKFFTPIHSPPIQDETKPQKHHHHHHQQHPHHRHHIHYHQDAESHSYTKLNGNDRYTDESHEHHHHHQHGYHLHDDPHHDHHQHDHSHPQQPHHGEEDEILSNHHTSVTVSRASSSLSSSSSSASSSPSSWYSTNDPLSIRHTERPQHSLSCSNILEVRGGFQDEDGSEPIVFATIKHGNPLHRGHSCSDKDLQQTNDKELGGGQCRESHLDYGPLYKTASLSRSLAFSEEDILLGVSGGPKRAVSSSQLPGKGILKNREPHVDIRKAKSMEVLSPRVDEKQGQSGEKGKGITQAEIKTARENFVQGKLQFSAFLDEITKQVISPSHLSILGVNNLKSTGKASAPAPAPAPAQAQAQAQAKPQLPPKKHRESSGEEREQRPKQHSRQEKATRSNLRSHSQKHSNQDNLISYAAGNHHGSPPLHHYPQGTGHHTHHGGSCKDRKSSPTQGPVARDTYGRCGSHLTDGTNTSPETVQPKHRHHHKQWLATSDSPLPHAQHLPQHQPHQGHPSPGHRGPARSPPSPALASGPGLECESPSSKSDSSRTRDTASTATSQNSEQSGQHHSWAAYMGYPKHRDTLCDADQLQALQEENADLHQSLLQTVVCIESLETELQRTREELRHAKEKYKSFLDMHTGPRQANHLLREHLHTASESLSIERKYLLNCMAQLSSELEDAHRTIAALENINVPVVIKELLEKHFDSAEAIQTFLKTATPVSHYATSPQADNQSHAPKVEAVPRDWLKESDAGPHNVRAFMPWKQEASTTGGEDQISDQHESSPSPPFSVADISTAIYKKIAAGYAASPRPFHPQLQQHPSLGTNNTDTPHNLQQACMVCDGRGGVGGIRAAEVEQGVRDVTSLSAQRILDDFMHQLHPHTKASGEKEQQDGQEWVRGPGEETGRMAE